ncbi:MAG: hypothetical protein K2J01_06860 [Clostridiales bacterium]|nr:hypothetical protein [Clostridiales bacterium]
MKETKTVQVYPSDDIVNATIEEYESFGWEVVSNQRCQEFEGTTHDIFDGSTTRHYSTFNKITFSREKESHWYDQVATLEKEYNITKDTIKSYKNYKPVLQTPKPEGTMGMAVGCLCFAFWIIPGIIYVIARSSKKRKYQKEYNKALAEYNSTYPAKIKELEAHNAEIRAQAEKCILGK